MVISRLRLRNWRNFRAVDFALAQRTFLIGPNASGKSNLLDVLRFLRDIAKEDGGGLQRALGQRGGLSKIRCLAARQDPDVVIEIELAEEPSDSPRWRYAIGLTQQGKGQRTPLLKYERVWREDELILDRPDLGDQKDPDRLRQTHLEQLATNQPFREMAKFLESIRYLHIVPQLIRNPEEFQGGAAQIHDPFGRNFLELVVKTPEKTRRARLKRIESALRVAVPQFRNLTDVRDEMGIPHLEAVYEHWHPNAGRQREDQFSDGTLRLIGLLWVLLEAESPLLLEEPELSLHSDVVRKLPALFHRAQKKGRRQIIMSTHSSDLLQDKGIGAEEILLLTPRTDGTTVASATEHPQVLEGLAGGLSAADLLVPMTRPANLSQLSLFE